MANNKKHRATCLMACSSRLFTLSFFGIIAAVSATFFSIPTPGNNSANNVCIYSANPGKYSPKCFMCLISVYSSALNACINTTVMPNNVSYSQATCIEKNCAINYPKPAAVKSPLASLSSLSSKISPFLSLIKKLNDKIKKRSIEDSGYTMVPYAYAGEGENKVLLQVDKIKDIRITNHINAYASELDSSTYEDEDDKSEDYY